MATINEMRQVATQIENETQVGGNTASRVGGLFNDVVDKLENVDNITPLDETPTRGSVKGVTSGGVYDAFMINTSENVFDFQNSGSINPSSANFSVTKNTLNETITITTLKRINSDTVKGGFTCPNLTPDVVYTYSFDYTNHINGAHLFIGGVDKGAFVVGSGRMVFNTTQASVYVSLPRNTAMGETIIFGNISIINEADELSIKDAINNHETRISENAEDIEQLKDEVISVPMNFPFANMSEGVGIISYSSHNWNNNSTYRHLYFSVTPEMKGISIQGNGENNSYISFLKSYNYGGTPSGTPDYCNGYSSPIYIASNASLNDVIEIPSDCNYIVINKNTSVNFLPLGVYIGYELKKVVSYITNINTVYNIPMEVGHIMTNNGKNSIQSYDATTDNGYAFSSSNGDFYRWRNVGMIEVEGGEYTISFDKGDICWVFLYDENRAFISATEYGRSQSVSEVTANTTGARFLRLVLLKKSATFPNSPEYTTMSTPKVTISGIFANGINISKLPKQNNTCDTIVFPVWIEDTYSCENTTTNLQDNGAWHIDFGRIRFPENYKPYGEPVRLIIYCHGGTPRYNPVYSGDSNYGYVAGNFNTTEHVDPTLFLAEGYAVMDIDGVFAIFNEKEDSNGIRANSLIQTAHCYQAAYDFCVSNYNIKKDGILLGGISFGGSKSLQIITHSHIPVIAAALESPYVPETVFVNGPYRGIIAKSVGIRGLSETGNLTNEDIDILKEDYNEVISGDDYFYRKYNYGKLLRALPILGACNISVDEFFSTTHIDGIGDVSLQNNESVNFPKYVVSQWSARFTVPMKLWCCTADTTSVPYRNGQMLYAVGTNGGSDIELRIITGGSHTPSVDANPENILKVDNYITRYGQILATVPLVYAEMIRYWRRYEQKQ